MRGRIIDQICAQVAEEHGVTVQDLRGASQLRKVTAARKDAYRRIREVPGRTLGRMYSLPFMARYFHRHHTSILFVLRGGRKTKHELRIASLARRELHSKAVREPWTMA